jgi:peptide/nickel transport system substrate-binding protein
MSMRAVKWRTVLSLIGTLVICSIACASPAPSASTGAGSGQANAQPPAAAAKRKVLTIALQSEINALVSSVNMNGINTLSSRYAHQFMNTYVTERDQNGQIQPRLVTELPTLENGLWKLNPDGSMDVTWKLRSDVVWHDGRRFTSDDVRFGWEAERDFTTLLNRYAPRIASIETPDDHTAILHWSETASDAGEFDQNQMDVLPRWILGDALAADKSTVSNQPYFNDAAAFVGLGPFRTVDWVRGASLTLDAYDGYFQGRPKVDRVIFQTIPDPSTASANVLAGGVDVSYLAVSLAQGLSIQQRWASSGEGTVALIPGNWRHLQVQLRPEFARPGDMDNVNVRRALAYGMNKSDLIETFLPGQGAALQAASNLPPGTPLGDIVNAAVVKYPYDPTRAAQLLAEAGWSRGGDGILTKAGASFATELWGQGEGDTTGFFPVLQQQYRQLGIDINLKILTPGQDPSIINSFPGLYMNSNPPILTAPNWSLKFDSRFIPTSQNRQQGTNRGGFVDPAFDRASAALQRAVKPDEIAQYWAQTFQIVTDQVGVISMYYYPDTYIIKRGVTVAMPASNGLGNPAYLSHTWDVQ